MERDAYRLDAPGMGAVSDPAVRVASPSSCGGGGRRRQSGDRRSAIARNTLTAIFGMRLRAWEDGTPIRVYVLPDNHAVHVMFCKRILGVFPHQYRTAWDRLVYSGTGQAPLEVESEEEMRARVAGIRGGAAVVVASEEEMRAKVAGTVGAIGYLSRKMIDESVTVVPVD